MATFSTNQNRHFFAVTTNGANDLTPKTVGEGNEKCLFFTYVGAGHEPLRTSLIQLKNLDYIKAFAPTDMRIPLKTVKVTLDANINSGAPVEGQDYLLRIVFRQFYGMSDADQYIKDVAVHVTSSMTTATQFYAAMVNALNLGFSREVGANATSNPYLAFSSDANGLYIKEKVQDWNRGLTAQERVFFDVVPTTIYDGGDDVIWGVVTDTTPTNKATLTVTGANPTGIGNGRGLADLEWFCLGERGDQYRYKGWPNYIPTNYQIDPSKEYYVLEIHHAFTDTGVNSYRSEKDITMAFETKSEINTLIGEINEAADLEIPTFE